MAKFCEATGNAVMRPRDPPPSEQPREAYFAAFAIMWIALFMLPSARRRARGFLDAMPSSSLAAIYGWRAVQSECHRWLPDMLLVGKALKGLNEEYKQRWGQDALVPERTEPIPLWALKLMVDTLIAAKLLDGVTNRCYLVMLYDLALIRSIPRREYVKLLRAFAKANPGKSLKVAIRLVREAIGESKPVDRRGIAFMISVESVLTY